MTEITLQDKYIALVRELLEEVYTRKRETGNIPVELKAYVKGYFHAGLELELITEESLNTIIEDVNMQLFGRNTEKQKEMFLEIHKEYDNYVDVPAFFRKGKYFL